MTRLLLAALLALVMPAGAKAEIACPATETEAADLQARVAIAPPSDSDIELLAQCHSPAAQALAARLRADRDRRRAEQERASETDRNAGSAETERIVSDMEADTSESSSTRGFKLKSPPNSAAPKPAATPIRARRPRGAAVRSTTQRLPAFPWPAPKPVKQVAIPTTAVGGRDATLDRVLATLERRIAAASAGYETGVFGGPPNGFVLLTRMERIQRTGAPFPEANRFTLRGRPSAGLFDMLEGLLGEKPGYFRVIAFVVAGDLAVDPDKPVSTLPNVRDGAARLPPELGRQRLGDRRVFALVYAYQRPPSGAASSPWTEGAPSALQHLRQSGIARGLGL